MATEPVPTSGAQLEAGKDATHTTAFDGANSALATFKATRHRIASVSAKMPGAAHTRPTRLITANAAGFA